MVRVRTLEGTQRLRVDVVSYALHGIHEQTECDTKTN
jgi:hypothetical protein